jgi:hypothetical protein
VEVGELGEHELDGGEDHDEIRELDVLAPLVADHLVELLQGLAAGDHVDDVQADLHHQLLRHDDPEAQLLAERVLPQLVVPVEPLARHHLVHLHHLPQRVHRDDPGQDQRRDANPPANRDRPERKKKDEATKLYSDMMRNVVTDD